MTKIKLLLVEDNDTDALLVVRHLKKEGFEVDHLQVKTRDEMEKAFSDESWDLVISDYSLPGFGGKDALELFNSKNLDIPFILVSGTVGEDIAVTIMKGGANDYLMKTHLNRLGPAVKRELEETQVKREKKRIESVLTQTEKRFQRLIEDLRDVVFLSSMDGKKIYIVNPAFEAIYGRPLKELEQNPLLWYESIHDDDKALMGPMTEDLKTTGVCEGEYRIVKPDSSVRWVYDRRCLVYTNGEQEPLMGGVVMDVTEKKQVEEDLIRAKKAAEESSQLKSTLLQNMSHEFRTPMNGILGFSEFLFEELTNEESRTKAEYILTSGKRLQQTLESIMLYAQLESGIPLKPAVIDLAASIQKVAEKVRKQADAKGLALDLQMEDTLTLTSDTSLLERILMEIIDNAVKFTDTGGVIATARFTDETHSLIQVEVKDTGIGIPVEKHALIFEEFRQAEEGYDRPYEGSGLGLSIASKSIQLLGGELMMDSDTGQGSTFVITLPVAWRGDETRGKIEVDAPAVPPAPEKTKKTKPVILLVEDNDANIELIRLFMAKDYDLDVAKNGESSLKMVKQKQYDCILMDINLGPGMDGIDAITETRKIPAYVSTPIIAVTGYTFRNEKEFIISKGANHYIEKPFSRQEMLGVLSEALK
ncbi:MAG: response regulator [Bacteroidales bacterium]|nr:response regulator [Bacteroidales bacterium]